MARGEEERNYLSRRTTTIETRQSTRLRLQNDSRSHTSETALQTIEEKLDFLVESVKAKKRKVHDESSKSLTYKTMYISSYKEIARLEQENGKLREQLDVALARVEEQSEAILVCSQTLSKFTTSMVVSEPQ